MRERGRPGLNDPEEKVFRGCQEDFAAAFFNRTGPLPLAQDAAHRVGRGSGLVGRLFIDQSPFNLASNFLIAAGLTSSDTSIHPFSRRLASCGCESHEYPG